MRSATTTLALAGLWLSAGSLHAFTPYPWSQPPADAPEELRKILSEADQVYPERHKPEQEARVLDLLKDAVKRWPDSYDAQWRLSRAACWSAEGKPTSSDNHQGLANLARDSGRKAAKLRPDALEGRYFEALGIGEYSRGVGILTALKEGLESKFRDPLLWAQKKDDRIDDGGLYAALGRYKYELPWPLRDYDASVKYLQRGLVVNPGNLRVKSYLAESLVARDNKGDEALARKLLKEVVDATPDTYDPPDEMRGQKFARDAAKRLGWKL